MTKNKVDGVIESVRYKADGQVDWVRAYLRRGTIYSDWVLVEREKLVQEIKAGKNFQAGIRLPLLGGSFELKAPVKVIQNNGKEVLVTGNKQALKDDMEGIPTI